VKIVPPPGPRRFATLALAVAFVAGVVGVSSWQAWQHHERSRALADARAVARNLAFATASDAGRCPPATIGGTQFIACFTAPYTTTDDLKQAIVHAFGAAGVPVSGAKCMAMTPVEMCDVWVTRGQWHARATFTSVPAVPSPTELRQAVAAGTPAASVLAGQPHRPWSGVIAVSRFA
jgi:hypothetical protein